jgi:putative zinc finger protein
VSSSDFRNALLELIDTSPGPVDHPSPDQWLAYQRGELPAAEEARLQEHLARCRDCFDLAEGAAAFIQPDKAPDAGQEVGTAALWRLLRQQIDSGSAPLPDKIRETPAGPPSQPVREMRRPPYALAASFFVALVGLTAWSLYQWNALESLQAPQPNAPIFDFSAGERVPGQELTVPAGPRMLVFHPAEELPAYRLVIRDAATGRELSSSELRLDQDFALTLYLPALRPGRYRVELSDGSGGRAGRALETHRLRVTEPGRAE